MGSRSALGLVFAFCLVGSSTLAECENYQTTVAGDFGRVQFRIDVADDPQERAKGLMFVESMPTFSGMLFIYEQPQSVSFWMRNTLIPLDMLFIEPSGRIAAIHEMAIPLDETPIPGGDGISHVLEINGGLSERLGIEVGDVLQHPSFGPDALLPCTTN